MIGKTTIGKGFGGCVDYQFEGHLHLQEDKRAVVLEAVGVRADTAAEMTADFNRGRRLNSKLTRAVWHTSISFNPDDTAKMSDAKMLDVARDYIKGMGLANTQYAVIRHNDQPHAHFHIVANRVSNDGTTISDGNNYYRSQKLLKELTEKHGLTPVGDIRPELTRPDRLDPVERAKYEIGLIAREVLKTCTDPTAFAPAMAAKGVDVREHRNDAGKATGISFKYDGQTLKGSSVHRSLSLAKIVAQINANAAPVAEKEHVQPVWWADVLKKLAKKKPLTLQTDGYQVEKLRDGKDYRFRPHASRKESDWVTMSELIQSHKTQIKPTTQRL